MEGDGQVGHETSLCQEAKWLTNASPPFVCVCDVHRWLKFEEDVEDGGERWSKPYVATLSLHSLFELRSCIMNGTVMLDMRANSLEEIAGKTPAEFPLALSSGPPILLILQIIPVNINFGNILREATDFYLYFPIGCVLKEGNILGLKVISPVLQRSESPTTLRLSGLLSPGQN